MSVCKDLEKQPHRHNSTHAIYAVKCVRLDHDEEAVEVSNLLKHSHPNIVRYFDSWIDIVGLNNWGNIPGKLSQVPVDPNGML